MPFLLPLGRRKKAGMINILFLMITYSLFLSAWTESDIVSTVRKHQCIPVVCFCRFHVPDGDPSFAGNIQQYGAGTQGGYKNRGNFRAADL